MKIKHLLIGLFAVAATVACKPEEVVETPKLDVDKTAVQVAATAGEASFSVTSNNDWTADADADWVSLDPASGKASDKAVSVKVTAEDNASEEPRTAKITVKAGGLTKTVSVSQTGATGTEPEPEPEPEPDADTYILVGEAVGGWDVDANGVVLTLKEGYYVATGVGITAQKGMHFTKNNKWEGNVKGLHGLIAPNEIGEVGNNDISLTEGGAYDVYLTEALDKFYFMSPGKLPSEAVEHMDIAVTWGVCGAIEGNSWGASADPVMNPEGEWFVARNIVFTEVNFKVRGNNSWSNDVKWGRAAKDQACRINEAIAVSTCTEYIEANPDAGDNENIYIGGAGTYDVYFSPDKKEVWVMTPGYKPGDETPAPPVTETTYTVVGTLDGINWNNAAPEGLMTLEGDYYVGKNVPFVTAKTLYDGPDQIEFKIVETGTWNGYGVASGTAAQSANAEIAVVAGGENIPVVAAEGAYDVYFDKENGKVWVMTPGQKPGDTPAPSYTIDHKQWMTDFNGMPMLIDLDLVEEGALVVALPLMDNSGFGMFMSGMYEVTAANGTSGTISFVQYDAEWDEFLPAVEIAYSNLTATTVDITCEALLEVTTPVTFTLVENPYEIELGGGEGPAGEIENGEYWFIEPTSQKVMTALAETSTYGRPAAADAVGGASTAKNAYTFIYNADWSCYTIQDSYGRYLYQSMQDDGYTPYRTIALATTLPAADDENMAYYMWTVYSNGDGTYDVYNCATYYSITYSSTYNNWEIYDPYEPDFANLFPSLVKADNPVAEPEVPAGPVEATVAEFLAAAEDETVYQLTGVITSVANTTYGNFYLKDDTGEVYIYGLCSPEGATKYWAESGAKVGDTITVQTVRTSYNGSPQGKNAIFVSLVPCEPEPEPELPEGSVAASATFSTFGYANAEVVDGVEIAIDENVKVVFKQGGASTAPAYYTSGEAIRMYQNGATLDVTASGKTITSIEITFSSNHYYVAADSGEFTAEAPVRTWTGEAESVKFTSTGTDKNHRAYVSAIKVIYK